MAIDTCLAKCAFYKSSIACSQLLRINVLLEEDSLAHLSLEFSIARIKTSRQLGKLRGFIGQINNHSQLNLIKTNYRRQKKTNPPTVR